MENNNNIENKILNGLKTDISIFNFRNEVNLKKYKTTPFYKKIAVFLLSIITISTTTAFAFSFFRDIYNTDRVYSIASLKTAEEFGYIENVEMDYIYSNNIGAKVNNITISDNDLDFTLQFDFSKNNLSKNRIFINYIIYDENNNIYAYSDFSINKRGKFLKKFYKNMNINYNSNDLYENIYSKDHYQNNLLETKDELISQITLNTTDKVFPKSKILYLKIYDIGYIENTKYISISNKSEWNIEMNIPDKFYNRKSTKYKLSQNIDNFKLDTAYITDTSMNLIYTSDNKSIKNVSIVDENGKEYMSQVLYQNGNKHTLRYPINSYIKTNKLYLKITFENEYKEILLIEV